MRLRQRDRDPARPGDVRRLFRQLGARAGVGPVVPYQLRHTAASLLLDNGATIEEAADMLGDNPTTIYRHRLRVSASAAVTPMERLFGAHLAAIDEIGSQLGGQTGEIAENR
jgi:integrase